MFIKRLIVHGKYCNCTKALIKVILIIFAVFSSVLSGFSACSPFGLFLCVFSWSQPSLVTAESCVFLKPV